MDSLKRLRGISQRLAACVLVLALILHSVGIAMAGARPFAEPAGSTDWAGFELCRHDNAAPALPGAPEGQAVDAHCMFCVAGPGFVLEPPAAASTLFDPVEIAMAPWPAAARRLMPATVDASARPRGPPFAA
jgi:hypothetical protein